MRHTNKDLTKKSSEFKWGMSFKELSCLMIVSCLIFLFWSFVLKGFHTNTKFGFILGSIILHAFLYLPVGNHKLYKWFYKSVVFLFTKKKYSQNETKQFIPYKDIINQNVVITNSNKYLKVIKFQGYDVWTQNEVDIQKKLRDINFIFESIDLEFEIVKTNGKNDLNINIDNLADEVEKRQNLNLEQIEYYTALTKDIQKEHKEVRVENYYLVLKSNDLKSLESETLNFLSNAFNIGINAYEVDAYELIDFLAVINNYVIIEEKLDKYLEQQMIIDKSEFHEYEDKVKKLFTFKELLLISFISIFKQKTLNKLNLAFINTNEDLIKYKKYTRKITLIDLIKHKFNKDKLREIQKQIDKEKEEVSSEIKASNVEQRILLSDIYELNDFTVKSSYIKYSNGSYQTFLNVQSLPQNLGRAYLSNLLSDTGSTFFKLEKLGEERTNKVINYAKKKTEDITRNKKETVNIQNESYMSALEEILDVIVNENKSLYTYNTFIEVKANSLSELKNKVRLIKQRARNNRIKIETPLFSVLESMLSNKLLNTLYKDNNKTILIDNFIQGWYFLQNSFNDYNNLFVGKGINNEYIFFDRFKKTENRTNANMFITGTSGAGKSTFAEKMILNDLANNRDVIVLDLQQEYKANGQKMNATLLDFADNKHPLAINVLQIREQFLAEKEEDKIKNSVKISLHIEYLEKFFQLVFKNQINSILMNYLKKCLEQLYEENGYYNEDLDFTKIKSNEWVRISDLITKIDNYKFADSWEEENFSHSLKMLSHELKLIFNSKNTLSQLFNNHTNFDIDSQYTIFDLHNIINTSESADENYSQILLYVLLHFLQDKIAKNRENKKQLSLFIGEAHFFVQSQNKVLFNFLFFTIKTARKYGVSVVLDTQNLGDFYREEENSNALLSNCDYSLFLRQKSSEIEEINNKLFGKDRKLTETEKEYLERANVGQGVLNISNLRYLVKIHYNDYEKEVLFKSKGEYI